MYKSKYDWDRIFEEFKSSGLSRTQFIKRKRLPTSAYSKLAEMQTMCEEKSDNDMETGCATNEIQQESSDDMDFMPVIITQSKENVTSVPVVLTKDGWQFTLHPSFDEDAFRQAVRIIKEC